MRVLGFMSGTSLDAVDMAVLDTDGEEISAFGPAGEHPLSKETRTVVLEATNAARAWPRGAAAPESFERAARAVALEHLAAAKAFLGRGEIDPSSVALVGFHGQTVLHERPTAERRGRSVQLGDAALLARGLGLPVVHDFRTRDVEAGGEGAPLAPVYHAALARWGGSPPPVAVLNLGGVGNVTLVRADGGLEAFDTGPANGMIDLLVQERTGARCDLDGALARRGRVDEAILAAYLAHPYFAAPPPKSLDRFDFALTPVANLSLEDAAATLTAFAAESVSAGLKRLGGTPRSLILGGGGRRNPALVAAIKARCSCPVRDAEALGWRGDSIEAEAFAYLAVRSVRGLPLSFPGTTGVPAPCPGGRLVRP
jgi:anhydro-N-acetylmuramic acid kinase